MNFQPGVRSAAQVVEGEIIFHSEESEHKAAIHISSEFASLTFNNAAASSDSARIPKI